MQPLQNHIIHMLTYLSGQYTASPALSPNERGFKFGDGVFETIAVYQGKPYQWQWHMARLQRGLDAISLDYEPTPLAGICQTLMEKNGVTDGLLRIYVSRGTGGQGYLPDPSAAPTVMVEAQPFGTRPEEPVTLYVSEYEKISPRSLPVQCKTAQGLQSTLVRMEASRRGCFDGLLLNATGHLTETSSANLFWMKDGTLLTPSLACGVLEGSTRAAVLRLSPWPVREIEAPLNALQDADAVFITNVQVEALPVRALQPQGWQWQSEKATEMVNIALREDRNRVSD